MSREKKYHMLAKDHTVARENLSQNPQYSNSIAVMKNTGVTVVCSRSLSTSDFQLKLHQSWVEEYSIQYFTLHMLATAGVGAELKLRAWSFSLVSHIGGKNQAPRPSSAIFSNVLV